MAHGSWLLPTHTHTHTHTHWLHSCTTWHIAYTIHIHVRVGEVDFLELVLLDLERAVQDLVGLVRTHLKWPSHSEAMGWDEIVARGEIMEVGKVST